MTIPISLLIAHFIGDFVLQTDRMAVNKSKDWAALVEHVAVYTACFFWLGLSFMVMTFFTHLVTDAVTSRITSRLWFVKFKQRGNGDISKITDIHGEEWIPAQLLPTRHWFFVIIGLDQLIHFVTLATTLRLVG